MFDFNSFLHFSSRSCSRIALTIKCKNFKHFLIMSAILVELTKIITYHHKWTKDSIRERYEEEECCKIDMTISQKKYTNNDPNSSDKECEEITKRSKNEPKPTDTFLFNRRFLSSIVQLIAFIMSSREHSSNK